MKAVSEKKNSKRKNSDTNNNETIKKEPKIERKNIVRTEIFGNATLLPTTISYNSAILPDAIFLTTSSGQLITTSVNPLPSLLNSDKTLTSINNNATTPHHGKIEIEELKVEEKNIKKSGQRTEGIAAATLKKKKKNDMKPSATQLPDENNERTRKKKKKKKNTTTSNNNIEHQVNQLQATSTDSSPVDQPVVTSTTSAAPLLPTTQLLTTGLPTTAFVVANGSEDTKDDFTTSQTLSGTTFANFPLLASGLTAGNLTAGFTGQTNFTTFSLQSPLLTPGLTIPLYNSLVAVSATKDGLLPTLTKDLFPTAASLTTQKTTKTSKKNKNSNNLANNTSQNQSNMTTARGRKRTAQSRLPAKLKEPAAVARRNARERRRVKMVNDGFLRLRRHVPTDPKNKKLSKVKTLRLAIEYIHHLQQLLQDSNTKQTTQSLVSFTAQVTSYDDLDESADNEWLQSDSLTRVDREIEDDIFQTIDPARLRTTYTEYVTR